MPTVCAKRRGAGRGRSSGRKPCMAFRFCTLSASPARRPDASPAKYAPSLSDVSLFSQFDNENSSCITFSQKEYKCTSSLTHLGRVAGGPGSRGTRLPCAGVHPTHAASEEGRGSRRNRIHCGKSRFPGWIAFLRQRPPPQQFKRVGSPREIRRICLHGSTHSEYDSLLIRSTVV